MEALQVLLCVSLRQVMMEFTGHLSVTQHRSLWALTRLSPHATRKAAVGRRAKLCKFPSQLLSRRSFQAHLDPSPRHEGRILVLHGRRVINSQQLGERILKLTVAIKVYFIPFAVYCLEPRRGASGLAAARQRSGPWTVMQAVGPAVSGYNITQLIGIVRAINFNFK